MNLIITSDFPSTGSEVVLDRMRSVAARPSILWIPPFSDASGQRFRQAQEQFSLYGFDCLEYFEIDADMDDNRLSSLERYDILYLSGGDPITFQRNILRTGLSERLLKCLAAGRLVVAASGGSLQLTRNLSLFRLLDTPIDEVVASRSDYEALGVVDYELVPHLNRFEPELLEKVREYSDRVDHDIVGLTDGAAVLHSSRDEYQCVGRAERFRKGIATPINPSI